MIVLLAAIVFEASFIFKAFVSCTFVLKAPFIFGDAIVSKASFRFEAFFFQASIIFGGALIVKASFFIQGFVFIALVAFDTFGTFDAFDALAVDSVTPVATIASITFHGTMFTSESPVVRYLEFSISR